MKRLHPSVLIVVILILATLLVAWGRRPSPSLTQERSLPSPEVLQEQCKEVAGDPSVDEIVPGVWVARGFDLANTIAIATETGKVVVDVSSTPARAKEVRAAIDAVLPGPVEALIYTHSHLDHVGGGSSWATESTPVYATSVFEHGFFEKYGMFRPIESMRGNRQFGRHVGHDHLPCTSIGKRLDMDSLSSPGVLLPNRTFDESISLNIGGVAIELHAAPGETQDQLFVWLPEQGVLLPGDNFYDSFPNLYTIRGSRPRPVKSWIQSLDKMRRRAPSVLVPSHTAPIVGQAEVAARLTAYRDGIQWVRDQVVRGANEGLDVEQIVERTGLPPSLRGETSLRELYGQIDWSVRAIYANELGWFDGRPHELYPHQRDEVARRTVRMMGGSQVVLQEVEKARQQGDPRWSLHLLALLEDSQRGSEAERDILRTQKKLTVAALESLGQETANTNGRAYLLQSALEVSGGVHPPPVPSPNLELVDRMPIPLFFDILKTRLIEKKTQGIKESVQFDFSDTGERWVLTLRNGILEVTEGDPMPGGPTPVASVQTDSTTWRRLSTQKLNAVPALASGAIKVDGLPAFMRFMGRFDQSL